MAGGRPPLYSEEKQKKADEYVNGGFLDNEEVIPTKEGLAEILGVNEDTITNWSKNESFEIFGATIDLLEQRQKKMLKSKALENKWNAKTAMFILNADHGMKTKTEQSIIISPENKEAVDKAINEFLPK